MSEPDFMGFLDELLKLREMMAGAVAAFVSDGFTDEQARALVTRIFTAPQPTEEK